MFRNTYQKSLLTIFYSLGSKPLMLWDSKILNGRLRRITDNDLKSLVLEIASANVTSTFIQCPVRETDTLAIKLPFFIMILKNLKKYFTFEIQVLDDSNFLRRFRFSNFQTITKVNEFCTMIPLNLNESWNQIQLNLADLTKKVYNTNYIETTRVKIHANIRIRRVYFTDYLYSEEQLPAAYKIYKPKQIANKTTGNKDCENQGPLPVADTDENLNVAASRLSLTKRVSFVAENEDRASDPDPGASPVAIADSERRSSILKKSSIENDVNVREVLRASISFADSDDETGNVRTKTHGNNDVESSDEHGSTIGSSVMDEEENDDDDEEDEYAFSLENFTKLGDYELEDEADDCNGSRSEIM